MISITNTSATFIDNIYVTNNLTVTHTDELYANISNNFFIYEIFPLSINSPKENKILLGGEPLLAVTKFLKCKNY